MLLCLCRHTPRPQSRCAAAAVNDSLVIKPLTAGNSDNSTVKYFTVSCGLKHTLSGLTRPARARSHRFGTGLGERLRSGGRRGAHGNGRAHLRRAAGRETHVAVMWRSCRSKDGNGPGWAACCAVLLAGLDQNEESGSDRPFGRSSSEMGEYVGISVKGWSSFWSEELASTQNQLGLQNLTCQNCEANSKSNY
jgi:hypothetical protein